MLVRVHFSGQSSAAADTFRVLVVQDLDGAAVEDRDDGAGEISNGSVGAEQEQENAENKNRCAPPPYNGGETKRRTSDGIEPSVHR